MARAELPRHVNGVNLLKISKMKWVQARIVLSQQGKNWPGHRGILFGRSGGADLDSYYLDMRSIVDDENDSC